MRTWILSLCLCTVFACSTAILPALATEARETPLVKAVKRAQASVVNIHSERTARDRDVFEGGPGRKVNGMGTGVVIDERGYIITNQHVVADVDSLRCTLQDGSTYTARVISYDKKHDLAVIKIEPSRSLQVIPLGTSSDVRLGETVIAVGNAFGYEHTVTAGIISSLSRDVEVNEHQSYKNLLQTDASINPGNSGGPLLNLDGEVVGINVAIRAGAQRIGFAIPIDDARKYVAKLLNINRLNDTYHGLVGHDLKTPEQRKLVVDAAEANSPAASAGFQPGDVISQVGSTPVFDLADLERSLLDVPAGKPVEVGVQRNQEKVTLSLSLARINGAQNGTQFAANSQPNNAAPRIEPARSRTNVAADEALTTKCWQVLGLKLDKAPVSDLGSFRNRYRGGMKVVDVRPDSAASKNGINKGDILVGLHVWETVKHEDISYILNKAKLDTAEPLKFYVVRGTEILFGNLKVDVIRK